MTPHSSPLLSIIAAAIGGFLIGWELARVFARRAGKQ